MMENYELYIPKRRNPITGQFQKKHVPHNFGKKWEQWMPEKAREKALKNLELGRIGRNDIGGWNAKRVIAIKDGKIIGIFANSREAARKLSLISTNIRKCCRGERKRVGGIEFFWEAEVYKWKHKLK